MKKFYIILLLVFIVHESDAQIYSQYFDGADTSFSNSIIIEPDPDSSNIWQAGPPQKVIFDSAATQPNAMVTDTVNLYPVSNVSSFIAKVNFNFPTFGIFALQWKQKLDMDSDFDGGIIEFSIDSGITWQNVFNNPYVYNFYGFQPANADTLANGQYAFSGTDSAWRDIWLCFDYSWLMQFQMDDTALFRFTFMSDSVDNGKEGWMIDNMIAHITFQHTIKEVSSDKYLNVYPNPSSRIVHIETEKVMDYHIIEIMELVDVHGRIIEKWSNIPTKFWFDASSYAEGLYHLKVKTNLKTETVPLLIGKE